MERIYLDANGSCPAMDEARDIVHKSLNLIGNPSSFHDHGRVLRACIDEARQQVAQAIGVQDKDVIFTSGASEANRLFVDALVKRAALNERALKVVVSPFEHPSLLKPVLQAADRGYFILSIMEVCADGKLDFCAQELNDCDVLMACHAHNETGIMTDVDSLTTLVAQKTIVMSDISQSFSRVDNVGERVDVMTFSAQKMGGFAGCGGIVFRGQAKAIRSPWVGGGQERGFRPGTESVLLILALGEAARHVKRERDKYKALKPLRDHFENKLKAYANIKIIGENVVRLPNTSAVTFLDQDPDALRIACDMAGLSVGFGAACSGLAPEGSFALKRLGLTLEQERSSVRFSLPPDIKKSDVDEAIDRLIHRVINHKPRV